MTEVADVGDTGPNPRVTSDDLSEAIEQLIAPETWEPVGGPGTVIPVGSRLAINQTPPVHKQIRDFLEALRIVTVPQRMLTTEAQWLNLSREQLATRLPQPPPESGGLVPHDRQALAALPDEVVRYSGRITCFNGQPYF
jgi:hypothetical protein